MATTTTNFGWDIPQSTDLVKDGATAIAALGQDIDTAFVDLKGGTTGQVLAKASNTDLDYSWVTQDDANAIQNAQLTAKGALISAFSAGSPATLTVGSNNQVLTADSTTATGLAWVTPASSTSALTLIATASPSGAGSVNFNSCFSSTYQNYQIQWNLIYSGAYSDADVRLRATTTDATTNYNFQFMTVRSTTVASNRSTSQSQWTVGGMRDNGRAYGIVNISNPFAAAATSYIASSQDPVDSAGLDFRCGSNTNSTSYDGLTFFVGSGSFTGTIRIYGVQNS